MVPQCSFFFLAFHIHFVTLIGDLGRFQGLSSLISPRLAGKGNPFPSFSLYPKNGSCPQDTFPDGVLWVDFRNKLDETGLLLRERLQDVLSDLTPPGLEVTISAQPVTDDDKLRQQVADRLSGKRFCIFVDNVHAHDTGWVLYLPKPCIVSVSQRSALLSG